MPDNERLPEAIIGHGQGRGDPTEKHHPRPRIAGVERFIWSPPDEMCYARKTHGRKAALQ
jgi:hypothetical protein